MVRSGARTMSEAECLALGRSRTTSDNNITNFRVQVRVRVAYSVLSLDMAVSTSFQWASTLLLSFCSVEPLLRCFPRVFATNLIHSVCYTPQANRRRLTNFTSYSRVANTARCLATTAEAAKSTPSPPPPATASADVTVNRIVDDISGLTLLQAADLVTQLKVRGEAFL